MNNNKVITAGLAAAGLSARVFHAPLLQAHFGFNLKGLVVRTPRDMPPALQALPIYTSFDALLNDPAIELVIINTPHHLHHEQAQAALLAGKHCLIEKPVCLHEHQVAALVALAQEHNLVLTSFQNRRFDADFTAALTTLPVLGTLVEAEFRFDRWRPLVDSASWKEGAQEEAGVFWNLVPHLADQALQLFGPPQSIAATERVVRQGGIAPDFVEVTLTYPKASVRLHVSYLAHPDHTPRIAIMGTQGCFYSHGTDRQEELLNAGRYLNLIAETKANPGFKAHHINAQGLATPITTNQTTYQTLYDHLHAAICGEGQPTVSANQMLALAKLLSLCRESIAKGGLSVSWF